MPNIDINIKCGNSLISRFDLDADLGKALQKSNWTIDSYRVAVDTYRNAKTKEEKHEMERLIESIKGDFRSEIALNDPKILLLSKRKGELLNLTTQTSLFDQSAAEKKKWKAEVEKLTAITTKIETEIEEIKSNKIYENAFEWRFEFPEVLDDEGKFVGFDVVIGNPPYVNFRDIKNISEKDYYLSKYKVAEYQSDLFILFIEKALNICVLSGGFGYIIPNSITNNLKNSKIRAHLLVNTRLSSIVNTPIGVFPDATVDTVVLIALNEKCVDSEINVLEIQKQNILKTNSVLQSQFSKNENNYFDFLTSQENRLILDKIEFEAILLDDISISSSGIKEYETGKGKPAQTEKDRIEKVFNSNEKIDKLYRRHIEGKEVQNYHLNWKGGYLKYGEWIAAPRSSEFFEGERIIIREIPSKNRLLAAYTDEEFTVKNSAHVFRIKEGFVTKYVTAILNSTLMGYYFVNKFSERDDVFPKAKLGQCRLLPIKMCEKPIEIPIITLVDQILAKKAEDPAADTSALEKEIDQLVYALYGLTEEEIKIVEGV